MPPPIRLLVCSIGNPGAYLNTLHSAGHTVLASLSTSLHNPPFAKSRAHGNGLLSAGPEFVLWQSMSLMNVSGAGVAAAWRTFQTSLRLRGEEGRLVVVHDELELAVGAVGVKKGDASPRGHNGLKSVKEQVRGEWWRVGVGIGRPGSREASVVAEYVLRKMSAVDRGHLEGAVGKVEMELRLLAAA
ncbi:peptidyl-tRNA hydrolase [Calycina marina]|uniref:peptidyl-tRNA hydrolase n=1 Tax=Calycina marina TaxID=1763456 RepID=A0A9P7Z2L7_9HELO|nr:peptidyl-tRNA hydrolase [Calycina marina]